MPIIASPSLVEYASFIIIIINLVIKLNLCTMYTSKITKILDFVLCDSKSQVNQLFCCNYSSS